MVIKHPYPPCDTCDCTGDPCHIHPKFHGLKLVWPELVGVNGDRAKAQIEKDNPYVTVVTMARDMVGFGDVCCNRVYLWVDKLHNGVVISVPKLG